jgi:hypothetical protein
VSDQRLTREELLAHGSGDQPWYAVRCVFRTDSDRLAPGEHAYEERITLWRAESFDDAIAQAEAEAHAYVETIESTDEFTGLAQAFHLFDDPGHGMEVFSLIRRSRLDTDEYLARFFDTGDEFTRTDTGSWSLPPTATLAHDCQDARPARERGPT